MSATQLVTMLRAAGLTVREDPGWDTRGNAWTRTKPIGVMHHHTSLPVPYPINRLNGDGDGRVKCNMNTKPDGTVWMVAYKASNYSSGKGSSVVFNETLNDVAPPANARERGLTDDMFGNRYYWNFENDHAGDGGSLPEAQFNAIVIATQIVNAHFGLNPKQVIAHAEWTRRKVDPYWDGSRRAIVDIRDAVSGVAPTPPPTMEDTMLPLRYEDGWSTGPRPQKRSDVALLQAMFGLDYGAQQGFYGPTTAKDLATKLGRADPVNEFGWQEAQEAAARGLFVGGTVNAYTKTQSDARYATKSHPHTIS